MPAALSLCGIKFGKLTVISRIGRTHSDRIYWECLCDCGQTTKATTASLRGGSVTSCGCSKSHYALGIPTNVYIGMSRTPEYTAWIRMRRSCYDTDYKDYPRYGGRGIRVCDEWLHDFTAFLSYVGNRPSRSHSIDRFPNNNGNYEPGNVRWATQKEQARNRRTCAMLTHNGTTLSLVEWSDSTGIPYKLLKSRHRLNWPAEQILATPAVTPTTITLNGETHTIAEWSKKTGIKKATIAHRLRQGFSPEKVLASGGRTWKKKIEHNGMSMTVSEFAKKLGIPARVIYGRLGLGWTMDQIASTPHAKRQRPR